ncbi:60S ribosomal protein L13a-like [Schistocerca gregaria]|uniref:60S ribosomal protein L13a-like n=1 Tax=Schistocerca gregaria TaxID=7010 RepID=UPI00211DB318|nr:60S ribosomal protein L13a-like [Schistocerca gregaria]
MFEKQVVIDCRGHILGRLASTVAKELLCGQRIVAVRCEQINISGKLQTNFFKYLSFLRKRTNTNPRRGPIHYRSPEKIFWRVVRGMIPYKTYRGRCALRRLQAFSGIPAPYTKCKRVVIPQALRVLRLRPDRRFTVLGQLSSKVGWKRAGVIKTLEKKRKIKSQAYYQRLLEHRKIEKQARENLAATLEPELKVLEHYHFTR